MSLAAARLLSATAALLALSAACTLETDDLGEVDLRCAGCNMNSPHINGYKFPELHLGGAPNSDGVSLIGLRNPALPGVTYRLSTNIREALVAVDGNDEVVRGEGELVGWQLVLMKNNVEKIGTIEAYDATIPGWDDLHRPMSVYAISFDDPSAPAGSQNVCPTWNNLPFRETLTIIRGQTYNREQKRVDLIDPDWLTFACADQAAYKAKALGYQQSRIFEGTFDPATREQQDATLKMITADYCGIGHSFTEHGVQLNWENAAQTVTTSNTATIEAMWDADGAICLNDTPRLVERHEVKAVCGDPPPTCDMIDPDDYDVEWITYLQP